MWEDPAIIICFTFFLGPYPPQYIRDGEWSAKFNLIPIYNKNKIGELHRPPLRFYQMTLPLKNYGRNDTPFIEICINTKDKSLNDFPNEIFHFFFLIPIPKKDKMTLLPSWGLYKM